MYPCGFCLKSSVNGQCKIRIVSGKVDSKCPLAYPFQVASASKVSLKKPCTNVPIECIYCPPLDDNRWHWKYSVSRHLRDIHPDWQKYPKTDATRRFDEMRRISEEEEIALGIPEEKVGRDANAGEIYDAQRTGHIPTTRDTHAESPQRQRIYRTEHTSSIPLTWN